MSQSDMPKEQDTTDQVSEPQDNREISRPSQDKGTFVPLIFGGAVACALGFFAGQLDWVEQRLGLQAEPVALASDLARQETELSQQRGVLDDQSQKLDDLSARLTELAAVEAPVLDLSPVNAAIKAQSTQLEALGQRLLIVEKRPMTDNVSREAIAAYEEELAALQEKIRAEELRAAAAYKEQLAELQTQVESQQAEVERILTAARESEADAADKAKRAMGRAALAKIVAAMDDGTPFVAAVSDLESSGVVQVPDILKASAEKGVPTLAQLQSSYPDAARVALSSARASADDANTVGGFLKRQLGARSTTPQEGDDPDAVLSRAEAAVRSGKIGSALSEIGALPEDGRNAMADWVALAEKRHDAQSATAAISNSLNTN